MEKSLFEQMGGTYIQVGDYLLPNLTLPKEEQKSIGIWGCGSPVETSNEVRSTDRAGRRDQRLARYLKQHHKVLYMNLLTNGELNNYLADINEQAEDMFSQFVKQMTEREGVTEQLKANDQMAWVGQMNNIRSRVTELINMELIYSS